MMNTVFGELFTADGLATTQVLVQGPSRPEVRRHHWASPASELRAIQAEHVPIDLSHDGRPRGELVHLERRHGRVFAVGHIDTDVTATTAVRVGDHTVHLETDLFWSAERRSTEDFRDLILDSVALVPATARLSAQPVTILPGALDHRAAPRRWNLPSGYPRDLLERAATSYCDRRLEGGGPLVVHDDHRGSAPATTALTRNTIETRSAEVADVSYPNRTVEIVAAPYNTEAHVVHEGRLVSESFSNTAFIDVDRQANRDRIRVWLNHKPEGAVGRVTALDPLDPAGLIAEFKLSKTRLGEEALELAKDGVLDASVGFKVLDERWEGRSRRRVTKAWLHHLGLTSDPAYDGTHVIDVRGPQPLS